MSIRTTFKGQLRFYITQLKPSVVLHQACEVQRRICWYLWSRRKPHSQRMLQFSAKLTLMLQLLLPHSHISGLRHHKFDLFLAFIPPSRWRRRKNLYILSGNEIFLPLFLSSQSFLPWYRRRRVAFLQSLNPLPHNPLSTL